MIEEVQILFDALLLHPLEEACGVGSFKDDRTSAFNSISNAQLRMLLNEHGIQYPAYNEVAAKTIARYLIEREHYKRKRDIDRVQRLTEKMETSMRFFGVIRFEEGKMTDEVDVIPIQAAASAEEPQTPNTKEEPLTTKKTKKAPSKKAAKTPKAAAPVKAAKTPSKKAAKPAGAKRTQPAAKPAPRKAAKGTPKRPKGKPQPKAAKRAPRRGTGERVRAPKLFTGKIKFLVKENPFRPDTKLAETFDLMRKTGTVEEYRKQCERYPKKYTLQYLWLVKKKGYIKIEG